MSRFFTVRSISTGKLHFVLLTAMAFIVLILGLLPGNITYGQGKGNSTPASGGLQGFHLVSADRGWLLLNQHLYWTQSTGQRWENITPPTAGGSTSIEAVSFVDGQRGWVVLVNAAGSTPPYAIVQTVDSGTTWQSRPLPNSVFNTPASAMYLQFIDSQTGWLVLKQPTSSNFSLGALFGTTDGGASWTELTLPIGDPVYFVTAQIGWVAGGATGSAFYRTQDGGHTWQPQTVGAQSPAAPQRFYQLPVFINPTHGVLTVSFANGQSEFYTTQDSGLTWTLAQMLATGQALAPNVNIPVAMIDSQHWVTIAPHKNQFLGVSADIRSTAVISQSAALTGINDINFPTADVGWAKRVSGNCTTVPQPNGNSSATSQKRCTSETSLLRTNNGGQSWGVVTLPEADLNTGSFTTTSQLYTIPNTAERNSIYGNTTVTSGHGFDKCDIPSLGQLQDWRSNSPYSSVNLYIGGSSRGCANAALSIGFLAQLGAQGWVFIPTWVGPQAACSPFTSRMSSDPATAYGQGVSEANAASDVAANLGLASGGAVIYYDLENYDTSNSACREAAKSFISGWNGQIRARANKAGVYGAACSSALSDFVSISNVPDAVWLAHWISSGYNSSATVWNVACTSNAIWVNHQRIRQYAGGHSESWGSTTLNIDSSVMDGLLATVGQTPGTPTITSPTNGQTLVAKTFIVKLQPGSLNYTGQADWRVQAATDAGFSNIVFDTGGSGLSSTSITVHVPGAGSYFVRAAQGDHVSLWSGWSTPITINVQPRTPVPETVGIFRPSAAIFYLRNTNTTGPADLSIPFGTATDLPIAGDWNGDGIKTIGIYRSSTGQFFLADSNIPGAPIVYSLVLGAPGDLPMVGDWNGDGKDGVGVFRPSNGLIYLRDTLTTGFADFQMVLGVPGDVPVAGDWNGDGQDSPGVYRPSYTSFYLSDQVCNCSVFANYSAALGIAGDSPFAGDWNGDGITGIGVFRPSNGLIYLKNMPTSGYADLSLVFGIPNDKPIAGYWAGGSTIRQTPEPTLKLAPTFVP
ncbi:MAG: glycoside hydrolase domain-containing protein [Chloroflexota bacterium]